MAETNQRKTSEQKRQYWQSHNEACRKSGQTREAYCTQHNLNVKTFAYWRQRLKKEAVFMGRLQTSCHNIWAQKKQGHC